MAVLSTEHELAERGQAALAERIDRLSGRVDQLTALVRNLHEDAREALALSYAACESDVRMAFAMRQLVAVLDKWSRTVPEALRHNEELIEIDRSLRETQRHIEQSAADTLAEAQGLPRP